MEICFCIKVITCLGVQICFSERPSRLADKEQEYPSRRLMTQNYNYCHDPMTSPSIQTFDLNLDKRKRWFNYKYNFINIIIYNLCAFCTAVFTIHPASDPPNTTSPVLCRVEVLKRPIAEYVQSVNGFLGRAALAVLFAGHMHVFNIAR